jgi:mRNA deadenylase 3'-5' endonuclease subunit Ccr4
VIRHHPTIQALSATRLLSTPSATVASASADSTTSFRITTYNVLSSHLGGANYYTACKPEYLDADYRLGMLKKKLQAEFDSKSIICLQEVSITWAGSLHSYFSANGYYFVTTMYGNKFNNYMGVGIAYPMDKFSLVDCDITRIGDTKRIKYEKKTKIQQFLGKIKRTVSSIASVWGAGGRPKKVHTIHHYILYTPLYHTAPHYIPYLYTL